MSWNWQQSINSLITRKRIEPQVFMSKIAMKRQIGQIGELSNISLNLKIFEYEISVNIRASICKFSTLSQSMQKSNFNKLFMDAKCKSAIRKFRYKRQYRSEIAQLLSSYSWDRTIYKGLFRSVSKRISQLFNPAFWWKEKKISE